MFHLCTCFFNRSHLLLSSNVCVCIFFYPNICLILSLFLYCYFVKNETNWERWMQIELAQFGSVRFESFLLLGLANLKRPFKLNSVGHSGDTNWCVVLSWFGCLYNDQTCSKKKPIDGITKAIIVSARWRNDRHIKEYHTDQREA